MARMLESAGVRPLAQPTRWDLLAGACLAGRQVSLMGTSLPFQLFCPPPPPSPGPLPQRNRASQNSLPAAARRPGTAHKSCSPGRLLGEEPWAQGPQGQRHLYWGSVSAALRVVPSSPAPESLRPEEAGEGLNSQAQKLSTLVPLSLDLEFLLLSGFTHEPNLGLSFP